MEKALETIRSKGKFTLVIALGPENVDFAESVARELGNLPVTLASMSGAKLRLELPRNRAQGVALMVSQQAPKPDIIVGRIKGFLQVRGISVTYYSPQTAERSPA